MFIMPVGLQKQQKYIFYILQKHFYNSLGDVKQLKKDVRKKRRIGVKKGKMN
jgi:hypothetical protein